MSSAWLAVANQRGRPVPANGVLVPSLQQAVPMVAPVRGVPAASLWPSCGQSTWGRRCGRPVASRGRRLVGPWLTPRLTGFSTVNIFVLRLNLVQTKVRFESASIKFR